MEKINFIDRVPQNISKNGVSRYGIYNSDGTLKEYAYILKEDGAITKGTAVNKALFDLVDRNMAVANAKSILASKCWFLSNNFETTTFTNDIIPKTWTRTSSSSADYTNGDMTIKGDTEPSGSSARTLDRMFDGNIESRYYPEESTSSAYAMAGINLGKKYQITKLRIKAAGSKLELITSDDFTAAASGWDVRYEYPLDEDNDHPLTDDVIELTGAYQCYGLRFRRNNLGTRWMLGYEMQVIEWQGLCSITEFDFDASGLEVGTTILVKTTASGWHLLRFNDKDIFITTEIDADKYYELFYNGNTFDAMEIT